MGTVLAIKEDTPRVRDTPDDNAELVDAIGRYERDLGIINRLESFRQALKEAEPLIQPDARYFLLELAPGAGSVAVRGFRAHDLLEATDLYVDAEKRIAEAGGDAVLVSVDSVASLRRAYPNYFLDTATFLDTLQETLNNGL